LQAAPLTVPPDQTISGQTATYDFLSVSGPGVLTVDKGSNLTFGIATIANGGQLITSESTINVTGRIQLFPTGSSTVNVSGGNFNVAEVDVDLTGSRFIISGANLTVSGSIFVDGSIFQNNAVGGVPGPPPLPEMTIIGGTATAGTSILAQSGTINITNATVTTPELDAFIQGQININSGTIIATNAQDAVFVGAGSIINITGGLVQTTQLSVSGFNDGDVSGGASSSINISGGKVTASDTAIVRYGGQLHISGAGVLNSQNNGVTIKSVGPLGASNVVTMNGGTLNAVIGDAFRATDAIAIINVSNNATLAEGSGNLLNVITTGNADPNLNKVVSSKIDFTAQNETLAGDIHSDAGSIANVFLKKSTTLTAAVNENQLTGASGINSAERIVNLPPQTVNVSVDDTSTWNIRASSTLNSLEVFKNAHFSFTDPPADPFKTLVVNNLTGTGGIFRLNNDLAAIKGDLIEIVAQSQGAHLLTFNNRTAGSDLPVNTALLVVQTPDGRAFFRGEEDGGTFRYFVVRGDGSSTIPNRDDWYLVRGEEIPVPTPTPVPTPSPTPAPIPPEVLPPNILSPGPISRIQNLTSAANAAIGTFSATMPLFYADMDTLIERLGELRLLAQAPPPAPPTGISKEGGKEVVAPPPPVTPPAGVGVWFRGFGSGSHIDDQVSRSFHQNLGGFQVGADKRLVTRYGDLYLGGFLGYFYAHRDFQNQPFNQDATGTTNAFSVGAYGTLIDPSGFYADLVVKYTQLWNDFDAPNVLSSLGLGPSATANYSIPTFGASLEVGKRWDFAHFFVEPQGQIEGAWAGSTSYTVSTGLRVNADSQTSLRGRLGVRAGYHFDCGSMAFEPYAKVSVINEFLGGDRITTDQTSFFPTLSGVGIQAAGGVTARITNSIYLYGEYDYANSDKIRIPWAVDAGLRWEW
jgi:outer membrane autotransporter protein